MSSKREPSSDWNGADIRGMVHLTEKKFNIKTLPADMQRVYKSLAAKFGEEYGLQVMFAVRTAVELHRAWHLTLLTSKILQQLKDHFRLRMTWDLGVSQMQFRLQDGGHELHRKVPCDYDSEYQDMYYRIAVALMDGDITINEALIYQSETKAGKHTAASGRFLRDFPGRLVLYPLVAANCAVIFFNGDWTDFGIAALCGFAAGCVQWLLTFCSASILTDVLVGTTIGLITGLYYRYEDDEICLSAIFLGALYWFFYGTAFVIGILEIIAGELSVGVTRFIAVSVKTFVLSLGAAFGLQVVGDAQQAWFDAADNCNRIDLDDEWWRIPLFLLGSCAALGHYRFPILRYWRALIVMLVAYEVQYELLKYFSTIHARDNLDTATSNVLGSAAAVVTACGLSWYVNKLRYYHDGRILQHDEANSAAGNVIHKTMTCGVYFGSVTRLGRKSDRQKLDLEKKLSEARRKGQDTEIELEPFEENLIIETIVGSQDMNIWSILMPALYQLVPGSLIAKFWFNLIFPPPLIESEIKIEGTDQTIKTYETNDAANNVFGGLMVISTSLALGLLVGFAVVRICEVVLGRFSCTQDKLKSDEKLKRAQSRRTGMFSSVITNADDPDTVAQEIKKIVIHGVKTEAEADELFNAIDIDQSDAIDVGEVTDPLVDAGFTTDQIQQLFASMDTDESGEVSREEFRRAVLDKKNASLLKPNKGSVSKNPIEIAKGQDEESAMVDQVADKVETCPGALSFEP